MTKQVLIASVAALVLASAVRTEAADHLLAGKRLIVGNTIPDKENRNRIVIMARSESLTIAPPGSDGDPTCAGAGGGGARLTVTSQTSGESHTTVLPCQNWTGRKTGSWRYNDRALADGTCKVIQLRSNRSLRAICLGRGPTLLDYDLQQGVRQDPIDVTLEIGTGPDRYCLRFGGQVKHDGSNAKKFFAKDSAAPAQCAAP